MKKETTPSILVVSGDGEETAILKAGLELSGYRDSVFTACSSEEALCEAASRSLALVIYHQPLDNEDIQLCRTFRLRYGIPVLVLGNAEATEQIGAEAFLPVPYKFQDFLRLVQRFAFLSVGLFRKEEGDQKSLEEEELKYRDLFDRASDIILLMDLDTHTIIDAKKQAELAYGYTREELIGISLLELVPREQHPSIWENTKRVAEEGEVVRVGERIHVKKDGTSMIVTISASLVEYGGRKVFQDIVRDETERIRAEMALEKANKELIQANIRLQEMDRLKSVFLATMSHELRTPLNSIIGFTGIILQGLAGPLNDEQTKQLGMVQGSARHLLNLINDVLDISKIEAGQVEIVSEPFDMRQAIEIVVRVVTPLVEKRGLALLTRVAPEVGQIVSDRRRVEQILINLVNNAVKFTEKGEVRVECQVSDDRLVTRVVDTGMGIKRGDMGKLFEVFGQIDTGLARRHEGTGLGLSICKKLVEMLGGEIWVESEWGVGSIFTFTLPCRLSLRGTK